MYCKGRLALGAPAYPQRLRAEIAPPKTQGVVSSEPRFRRGSVCEHCFVPPGRQSSGPENCEASSTCCGGPYAARKGGPNDPTELQFVGRHEPYDPGARAVL